MFEFIKENLATIIISLMLICLVAVIIHSRISDKKKGKSSCGCGCAGCPSAAMCHKAKAYNKNKM